MLDFKLLQNDKIYDINFKKGDVATCKDLETATLMSIFCEKRATDSMIDNKFLQRGHITNLFNNVDGYEIGSFLWFYINQNKNLEINAQQIQSDLENSLKWMVEDDLIKNIEVNTSIMNNRVNISINFIDNFDNSNNFDFLIN